MPPASTEGLPHSAETFGRFRKQLPRNPRSPTLVVLSPPRRRRGRRGSFVPGRGVRWCRARGRRRFPRPDIVEEDEAARPADTALGGLGPPEVGQCGGADLVEEA